MYYLFLQEVSEKDKRSKSIFCGLGSPPAKVSVSVSVSYFQVSTTTLKCSDALHHVSKTIVHNPSVVEAFYLGCGLPEYPPPALGSYTPSSVLAKVPREMCGLFGSCLLRLSFI